MRYKLASLLTISLVALTPLVSAITVARANNFYPDTFVAKAAQSRLLVRYANCPLTDAQGRTEELSLSGFWTKAAAEKAAFDYVNCLKDVDSIIAWLKRQGFEHISHNDQPATWAVGDSISARRSLKALPAIWGWPLSMITQRPFAEHVAISILFNKDQTIRRVTFTILVL